MLYETILVSKSGKLGEPEKILLWALISQIRKPKSPEKSFTDCNFL